MIELTPTQRRALRAAAHSLRPVASIGQHGLTEAVIAEIDRSLKAHELIKVKLAGVERDDREAMLGEIADQLDCAPVQHIGNTLVLWRPNPETEEAKPKRAPRKAAPKTKKQAAAAQEKPRRRLTRS